MSTTLPAGPASEVDCVDDGRRAAVLLRHPLRLEILRRAAAPASATSIARDLGLPRQKVNYHLRALARARFVRRAGDERKRNMIERRFVATARSVVVAPAGLGVPLAEARRDAAARASASHLVALAARAQGEAARAARGGKRIATLAIDADIRLAGGAARARFSAALQRAIAGVVARHAAPARSRDEGAIVGRPFRLVVLCHPVPDAEELR